MKLGLMESIEIFALKHSSEMQIRFGAINSQLRIVLNLTVMKINTNR